jgi:hypothetical protein
MYRKCDIYFSRTHDFCPFNIHWCTLKHLYRLSFDISQIRNDCFICTLIRECRWQTRTFSWNYVSINSNANFTSVYYCCSHVYKLWQCLTIYSLFTLSIYTSTWFRLFNSSPADSPGYSWCMLYRKIKMLCSLLIDHCEMKCMSPF